MLPGVATRPLSGEGDAFSPLDLSPVAYWPLQEASGTRVDATGRGNDLTDNNTVTQAAGPGGNLPLAALFTAANSEFLSCADNADLSLDDTDFTIAGWVNLTTKGAAQQYLASKQDAGGSEFLWLYYDTTDRFAFAINSGAVLVNANALGAPATGAWYFVVASHVKTTSLNIAGNNGTTNTLADAFNIAAGTSSFRVGAVNSPAAAFLNGRMAGLILVKRILTADEITKLYRYGGGA